jgi:RNA polymerase primary sigma factor
VTHEELLGFELLVCKLALKWGGPRHRLRDDFRYAEGWLALCRAGRNFDPARGVKFLTYAHVVIERALMQASARAHRHPEAAPLRPERSALERAHDSAYSVSAGRSDPGQELTAVAALDLREPWEESADREAAGQARDSLAGLLDALPPVWRRVLELRYGLAGGEPLCYREPGQAIGLSKERCRQIEGQALERLRGGTAGRKQLMKRPSMGKVVAG